MCIVHVHVHVYYMKLSEHVTLCTCTCTYCTYHNLLLSMLSLKQNGGFYIGNFFIEPPCKNQIITVQDWRLHKLAKIKSAKQILSKFMKIYSP